MKTYYRIFIAIFILFCHGNYGANAQVINGQNNNKSFQFDYTSENSPKFFDAKASSQPRMSDFIIEKNDLGQPIDTTERKFTTKYGRDVFAVNASLIPFDSSGLTLYSRFQVSYNSLVEQYVFDELTNRVIRADLSATKVDFLSLGASYNFTDRYNDSFQFGLSGEFRTPFGFHRGILNDPTYKFTIKDTTVYYLADGAFEALVGGFAQYFLNKWDFKASATYNWRDEELSDQALYELRARASSIPGTHITLQFTGAKSLSNIPKDLTFSPRKFQLAENWLDFGFGFDLDVGNINTGFIYALRVYGRNTWSKNAIKLWASAGI